MITENFGNLPSNCIAVVVRSDVSTLVAREDVSAENLESVRRVHQLPESDTRNLDDSDYIFPFQPSLNEVKGHDVEP